MANGRGRGPTHRASAISKLTTRGFMASRDHGTNPSLVEYYKELRSYGATASQAFDVTKTYRQNTIGDYYR